MSGGDASNQPGGRRLRCVRAATAISSAPIIAATARAAKEKGHTKRDQQERTDEVEHADGDEAKVLGDAERANHDECDGEDSHDVLPVDLRGLG
jgi:hypothetical protein